MRRLRELYPGVSFMIIRPWHPEAICLIAAMLATTLLFASGAVDIHVAAWFYSPDAREHWPLARQFPWRQLYDAASWLTAVLVLASLVVLAASTSRARQHWQRSAVLVLLAVAIGPGLLANVVFKDHWQHPRPRDIVELGGPLHYVPSPLIGSEGGASFPCGHCTVGFLYASGWWIWRRRRRVWAAASLVLGVLLGLLLGVGRLAAGAHFLSDVIWSALLAFAVLHVLHFHVLPAPAEAAGTPVSESGGWRLRRFTVSSIGALLGGTVVLLALFVMPHGVPLTARYSLASLGEPPRILEVDADRADVTILLVDTPDAYLAVDGELHGFGLPGSHLTAHLDLPSQSPPRLRYRIEERGWLTDVDGTATLRVPGTAFQRVIVVVGRGNIRLTDTTQARVVAAKTVQVELHTGRGRIEAPALPDIRTLGSRPTL